MSEETRVRAELAALATLAAATAGQAAELVAIAERSCLVTNTLRSGVPIALTIE